MSVTVSQLIVSDLRVTALRAPGERGPQGPAGPPGPQGDQGPAGAGIPADGNDGDMLVRAGIGTAWFATAAFGRSLLNLASAALLRTAIALPTTTTAGRLARYTDTAGALGEAANVFVDAAGNVGLGTDAPTSNLHIKGGVSKKLTFEHTNGPGYDSEIAASYNAGESFRISTAGANVFSYAKTANVTAIGADVGNSLVRVRSGSAPKLSFFGAGTSDTVFFQAGVGSTSNLGIYTNSAERIRIDVAGNVGVGVGAPTAKLHIADGIIRTDGTPFSPSNFGIVNYVSRGSAAAPTAVAVGDVFTIQQTQVRGNLAPGAPFSIKFTATAVSNYMVEGVYSIDTANAAGGTTKALTILSLNGNVGLGTVTPQERMQVAGGNVLVGSSLAVGTYGVPKSPLMVVGDVTLNGYRGDDGVVASINFTSNNGINYALSRISSLREAWADQGGLAFETHISGELPTTWRERMRITASGNVGVGTTAPTARIDNAGDTYRQRTARTPASASAAGNAGDICWDANFLYVCVATNTWKRSALATW